MALPGVAGGRRQGRNNSSDSHRLTAWLNNAHQVPWHIRPQRLTSNHPVGLMLNPHTQALARLPKSAGHAIQVSLTHLQPRSYSGALICWNAVPPRAKVHA